MGNQNRFGTKDRRFIAYPRVLGQGLVEVTCVRLRTVEGSGCSIGRAIWPPSRQVADGRQEQQQQQQQNAPG